MENIKQFLSHIQMAVLKNNCKIHTTTFWNVDSLFFNIIIIP